MSKMVALFRGINVGKAKRIAMADLRAVLEDLGLGEVKTILNSGNAVFTASAAASSVAAKIERAVEAKLGVRSAVLVITAPELQAVIEGNPLIEQAAENPSRFFVTFLAEASQLTPVKPLLEEDWPGEALALGARVVYQWCPAGMVESSLAKALTRKLGASGTARNWATTLKLFQASTSK